MQACTFYRRCVCEHTAVQHKHKQTGTHIYNTAKSLRKTHVHRNMHIHTYSHADRSEWRMSNCAGQKFMIFKEGREIYLAVGWAGVGLRVRVKQQVHAEH